MGRSTNPKPSPTQVVTSQTPQPTPAQNETNFCSNKLNFCIQVPAGWQAEETLSQQGGLDYLVTIKDQGNNNNAISIWKAGKATSSIKQVVDYYLKTLVPEISQGAIHKSVPSINGQNELIIFPTPSLDPHTVMYYYGDLFIQPDPKSDIFRLSAGAAPASGQYAGDILVKIGSSLKVTQ